MNSSKAGKDLIVVLCCAIAASAILGCGGQKADDKPIFTVYVTLDGLPVENVRVALISAENRQGPILYDGISSYDGKAAMTARNHEDSNHDPGESGSGEFIAVCESVGDWQIVEPWSSPASSPLTITWNGEQELSVRLPKKSVRPL